MSFLKWCPQPQWMNKVVTFRVSKNNKRHHIWSILRFNIVLLQVWQIGTLSICFWGAIAQMIDYKIDEQKNVFNLENCNFGFPSFATHFPQKLFWLSNDWIFTSLKFTRTFKKIKEIWTFQELKTRKLIFSIPLVLISLIVNYLNSNNS